MRVIIPILFFINTSCLTIPVYVHDKHTVMEMESSTDWEDFDREYTENILEKGSQRLDDIPKSFKEKKAFSVLNGEFIENKKN